MLGGLGIIDFFKNGGILELVSSGALILFVVYIYYLYGERPNIKD